MNGQEKTWAQRTAGEIIRQSLEQDGESGLAYQSIFGAKPVAPAAAITEVEAREVVDALAQYEAAVERLRQLGFVREAEKAAVNVAPRGAQ